MNKIEEIEALASLRRKEIGELQTRAEELPEMISKLDTKAAAAAVAGDLAAFRAAAAERDELKTEAEYIGVRLKKLQELPDVDPVVVREAWDDYRAKYDPQLEKKIAAFEVAKRKALDLYAEAVAMQTEAATIRCRFAQIVGIPVTDACREFPAKAIPLRSAALDRDGYGILRMNGTNIIDPDAVRFLSDYVSGKAQKKAEYNWVEDMNFIKLNGVLGAGIVPN